MVICSTSLKISKHQLKINWQVVAVATVVVGATIRPIGRWAILGVIVHLEIVPDESHFSLISLQPAITGQQTLTYNHLIQGLPISFVIIRAVIGLLKFSYQIDQRLICKIFLMRSSA